MFKGLSVCDVEAQEDAIGTSVEARSHGREALLAGGVPDLQATLLALVLHEEHAEVDGDGGGVVCEEDIFTETNCQTGFTAPRITNNNDFEDVITILRIITTTGHYLIYVLFCFCFEEKRKNTGMLLFFSEYYSIFFKSIKIKNFIFVCYSFSFSLYFCFV